MRPGPPVPRDGPGRPRRQSGECASRKILTATARGWVQGIAQEEVPALRALIAAEARRFPRLGRAWREQGPERFAEPLAAALRACPELGSPTWTWRSSSSTPSCCTPTSSTAPTATACRLRWRSS
ncbi:TetR/AcrR family transcriptional regulator C-terminal domain-containing protein [Streptomyces sp. NPDC015184]|uniref:TetR/AcrR family transcriptional regulator C-terminal domain-containing protein n=1 Tax=Streptomyces sp. NPDC015184 TaxID=3364946 RepID=UPI0036F86161